MFTYKQFKPIHISKMKIMQLCPERILEIMKIMELLYKQDKCIEQEAINRWMEIDEWRKAVAIPRTRWTEVNDYVSTLYLKKLMGRRE